MHLNKNTGVTTDEISLKELILKLENWFYFLKTKLIAISIAAMIGSAVGLIYSIIKKPIYKAELSFALQDENSSSGGIGAAMGLASQFGIDLGGSSSGVFSGDNLPELMKSRSMVEGTLLTPINMSGKQKTLADLYLDFNNYKDKWDDEEQLKKVAFPPNSDRSKFSLKQDSVLGEFYKEIIKYNLTVDKVDKKLSIIKVGLSSKNELFSKHFVEILTETVSDFYIATKTKRSVHNVNVLQHQTDSVRRELNSAITGVASSVDFNPNPNPALQILRVPSQRRQVDVQANQAILTQLVANLELSKITLRKETPLVQVIDRPILPLEKEKVGKITGLIIGAVILAFLAILYYSTTYVVKSLIHEA